MQRIPIVQTVLPQVDTPCSTKLSYSICRPLPVSYMSEYSVLGLLVDDLEAAVEVLRQQGIVTTEEVFGAEAAISGRNELPELIQKLSGSGIYCAIGDVIDSIYQG
jgi:hypothetical protein